MLQRRNPPLEWKDIIVIEDDPNDIEMMMFVFSKYHLDKRMLVIRDGQEAIDYIDENIEIFAEYPPKAIFIDINIPRMNGMEVLKKLKSDSRTKTIPTIMLTSSKEQSDVVHSYDLGANSYVVKPISFEEFTETIEKLGSYWSSLNFVPKLELT